MSRLGGRVPRIGSTAPPVSDQVITWLLERVTGKLKFTRAASAVSAGSFFAGYRRFE